MSDLIQIQAVPALSQSSQEDMACPRAYVAKNIEKRKRGDSLASSRGNEVHHVMAQYISACARLSIPADWQLFDELAATASAEAGDILQNLRDSYSVAFQFVYTTEITLAISEDLKPCHDAYERGQTQVIPGVAYTDADAAHHGTLDVLFLNDDSTRAMVHDFKTHPSPFEPDTYQAKLYTLMVFKHFPTVQTVKFVLVFARYSNCEREVTFQRSDVPELERQVRQARARQIEIHNDPDNAKAIPSSACTYCPLAIDFSCPVAEWNEYMAMSPEQRLMWKEWLRRMAAFNSPLLKAYAEVHGPVSYKDGNGKTYVYGPEEVASTTYPLDRATVQVLEDHAQATGEDLLAGKLRISSTSIKPLLKAKKRAALKEVFEDSIIQTVTKPKFVVRTPEEGVVQDYNPYESEE